VVAKDASLKSYLSFYNAMKELACPEWISETIHGFFSCLWTLLDNNEVNDAIHFMFDLMLW
jgi:hypothetical protein